MRLLLAGCCKQRLIPLGRPGFAALAAGFLAGMSAGCCFTISRFLMHAKQLVLLVGLVNRSASSRGTFDACKTTHWHCLAGSLLLTTLVSGSAERVARLTLKNAVGSIHDSAIVLVHGGGGGGGGGGWGGAAEATLPSAVVVVAAVSVVGGAVVVAIPAQWRAVAATSPAAPIAVPILCKPRL